MNLSKKGKYVVFIAIIFAVNINVFAVNNWVKVTSKNFQLVGNAHEKDIRKVAVKLEQFRLVFTKVYDKMRVDSLIPTTVIVFKDENSFKDFKPVENGKRKDWVSGFFQPGQDVNYIAISLEGSEDNSYRIIFHEYSHLLIGNTLGNSKIPTWLNEGLADYYENIDLKSDQKVRFGGLNLNHLKLLKENKLIPFEEFLKVNYSLLDKQDKLQISLFYAQSWAWIHFLIHDNSGIRKRQLTDFLDLLREGKKTEEAFVKAFQSDYQQLEREFKNYISNKSFQTTEFTLSNKLEFNFEMTVSKISDAVGKSFQGDLLLHMNRLEEAEIVLEEALSIDPKIILANISLGLVKTKKRDFKQAKKYLEYAVFADPENYSAQYHYAYMLSREGMDENGSVSNYNAETAEKMRRSLRKAISLNPNFAESYSLFAFICIAQNEVQNEELDEALAFLNKILEIVPENQLYILRTGELYLRKKNFEKSREIVKNVLQTADDEIIRNYAQNTLEKIDTSEKQFEYSKEINKSNIYLVQADKPLTAQALEELNKKIEIDSINNNLRKLIDGEKRIIGRITKIDCAAKGVIFSVKTENNELKFVNKSFNGIIFFTYKIELKGGAIGCDSNLNEFISIITYTAAIDEKNGANGEIRVVEFVPDYFVFTQTKKENE
jgi:DNA-binding Lrp family transcriptional regulator